MVAVCKVKPNRSCGCLELWLTIVCSLTISAVTELEPIAQLSLYLYILTVEVFCVDSLRSVNSSQDSTSPIPPPLSPSGFHCLTPAPTALSSQTPSPITRPLPFSSQPQQRVNSLLHLVLVVLPVCTIDPLLELLKHLCQARDQVITILTHQHQHANFWAAAQLTHSPT